MRMGNKFFRQADQIPLIINPHLYTGRNPDVVQLKLKNFPAVDASIIPFVTILIRVMEIVPVTFPGCGAGVTVLCGGRRLGGTA